MSVDLPTGTVLRGRERIAFNHVVEQVEAQFHAGHGTVIAHATGRKPVQEACDSKGRVC
jgi:hypothetical protein